MRRIGILVLAWVGLLVLTIGIRTLAAGSEIDSGSRRNAADDPTNEALQALLEAKPRKTSFLIPATGREAAKLDARLRTFMMEHDAGLRRCRADIMIASNRPKEFFELSFSVRILGTIRIEDAIFERSTLTLTREQEQCITDEFEVFELEIELEQIVPHDRLIFQFCFGGLEK